MRTLRILPLILLVSFTLHAQEKPLPIIDMHFHALYANAYGDEPTALCTPITTNYPVHDFTRPYNPPQGSDACLFAIKWDCST